MYNNLLNNEQGEVRRCVFLANLILYHFGIPGFFLYTKEIKEKGGTIYTRFATSSTGIIT